MQRILNKKSILSFILMAVIIFSMFLPAVTAKADEEDGYYSDFTINYETGYVSQLMNQMIECTESNSEDLLDILDQVTEYTNITAYIFNYGNHDSNQAYSDDEFSYCELDPEKYGNTGIYIFAEPYNEFFKVHAYGYAEKVLSNEELEEIAEESSEMLLDGQDVYETLNYLFDEICQYVTFSYEDMQDDSAVAAMGSSFSGDLKKTVVNSGDSGSKYPNNIYIHDESGLLSDADKAALLNDMEPITQFGSVLFYTTDTNNYGTTEKLAEEAFYQYFADGQSATAFVIDMDRREVFIYSDGVILRDLSESKATTITDNVYTYLGDGEYYEGSKKAFEQINAVLEGKRIPETMKVVCNILIAMNLGFLICYIVASKTSKTVGSETGVLEYAKVQISSVNPFKKLTHTTKTYIPPASSSGGSYRGGGHSGGGSHHSGGGGGHHGGGGGHRF